jgi:hypothetical protein
MKDTGRVKHRLPGTDLARWFCLRTVAQHVQYSAYLGVTRCFRLRNPHPLSTAGTFASLPGIRVRDLKRLPTL